MGVGPGVTVGLSTRRSPLLVFSGQSNRPLAQAICDNLGIPLGRIADPADIAAVNAFLISEAARHITMQEIVADGGATL